MRAQAMGFRIMVTLGPDAPRWATGGGRGGNYKIDADRFTFTPPPGVDVVKPPT